LTRVLVDSPMEEAYEFRDAMEQPIYTDDLVVLNMQERLIEEEYKEFVEAYEEWLESPTFVNRMHLLKELADLVFVCFQFAAAAGWDLCTALTRIFQSNMTKLVNGKPLRREDGKVLKGPNYKLPDLSDLV
jgi:NTP pyrophosphatase (non-canonical NTP hydrolase)